MNKKMRTDERRMNPNESREREREGFERESTKRSEFCKPATIISN
jgi:hypothetical protein